MLIFIIFETVKLFPLINNWCLWLQLFLLFLRIIIFIASLFFTFFLRTTTNSICVSSFGPSQQSLATLEALLKQLQTELDVFNAGVLLVLISLRLVQKGVNVDAFFEKARPQILLLTRLHLAQQIKGDAL